MLRLTLPRCDLRAFYQEFSAATPFNSRQLLMEVVRPSVVGFATVARIWAKYQTVASASIVHIEHEPGRSCPAHLYSIVKLQSFISVVIARYFMVHKTSNLQVESGFTFIRPALSRQLKPYLDHRKRGRVDLVGSNICPITL